MSEKRLMLALSRMVNPTNLTFCTEGEADLIDERLGWQGLMISMLRNKISAVQGLYFQPGTMTVAEQLKGALMALDHPYPTPRQAHDILRAVPGGEEMYRFESEGDLWSMHAAPNPTWRIARDRRWALYLEGTRLPASFEFDELVEAFKVLPLLNADHGEGEVRRRIAGNAAQLRLLELLQAAGGVKEVEDDVGPWPPGFTFLGHSALHVRTATSSITVDPCLYQTHRGDFDPTMFRLAARSNAILVSHNHWDHLTPSSLLRLPRDMRFYVPRVRAPTYANPSLAAYLHTFGFTDVVEVDPWDRAAIGDIEVTFVPFFGEPFGLQARIDGFTYLVKANGQSIYSSVDAWADEAGNMDPVMIELARRERVDVFLFCASNLTWPTPSVAGYAWRFSNDLLTKPWFIRYHPNGEDALRWFKILRPRYGVPAAQFLFDGAPSDDLVLTTGETRKLDAVYEQYWKERAEAKHCQPLEGSLAGLAAWKRRLDDMRKHRSVNIVPMHPLQRAIFQ